MGIVLFFLFRSKQPLSAGKHRSGSVFATTRIQYWTELSGADAEPTISLLKTEVCQTSVEEMFFAQLEEFCRMVQQEFLAQFNEIAEISNSSGRAMAFTESLMLCPTQEAARACIRRELSDALSFVLAIHGMQQQLQVGTLKLPTELPQYQTRFYLLAVAVRDYLSRFHAQPC